MEKKSRINFRKQEKKNGNNLMHFAIDNCNYVQDGDGGKKVFQYAFLYYFFFCKPDLSNQVWSKKKLDDFLII